MHTASWCSLLHTQTLTCCEVSLSSLPVGIVAAGRTTELDANAVLHRTVWGGGMFLPDAFYDACDEFGILIYHDMQYAQEGHSPAVGAPQDPELRYQIRRLSSHPSIAIWDGCNECQVLLNTSTGICKYPPLPVRIDATGRLADWVRTLFCITQTHRSS